MYKKFDGGYRIINLTDDDIFDKLQDIYNNESKPLIVKGLTDYGTTDHYATVSDIKIIKDENNEVIEIDISVGEVCYNSSTQKHYQKVAKIYPSYFVIEEVTIKSGTEISDATKDTKGIVQVGDNIDVTDGVVSVPVGTEIIKGVVSTGPPNGLNIYNGNISCSVVSLRHCNIPLDTEKEMTFESISWGSQLKDTKQYISIASSTVGFGDLTRRVKGTIIDENCFVAQQFSQEAEYINTTYFGGNVYDRSDLLADVTPKFLIKKVTIDSTDYFVRVPIMYNQEWRLLFDPKTYKQAPYLEGFCDFEINSDAWDKTNFIPEIEVGASGTKVMTYDTSTSQVVPMMKAFSVNITMPNGITYSIPSHELYVQDGKAYIVSVNIDLNQANPAVTDTFATFTFTRVF